MRTLTWVATRFDVTGPFGTGCTLVWHYMWTDRLWTDSLGDAEWIIS